jgi:hypothetical protein
MNKEQSSRLREGIEAQLRWAVVYGGDPELVDLEPAREIWTGR